MSVSATQKAVDRLPADTTTDSPPRCSELRRDGQPCQAFATSSGKCAGHSKLGMAADPQAYAAKGAAATNAQRRQRANKRRKDQELARMTPKQRLDQLALDQQSEVDAAFKDAIRTGSLEDLRRAQASELLLSRVYGRPTERVEDARPVAPVLEELAALSPEQRASLLASVAGGKRLRLVDEEAS